MSELGEHLKEVREQKNISLEDLQRTTKIQKRYLIAIEEGRLDTLPGLFYARAFVKTYAEAIGLDPDQVFQDYKHELPNPQREAVNLPSRSERTKQVAPVRTKKSSIMPALIAVVAIIAVVVIIWVIAQSRGAENQPISPGDNENLEADFSGETGEADQDEPNETELDGEGIEPEESEDVTDEEAEPETPVLTLNNSEGNTSYFTLEHGQLDNVRIEMKGNSYIDIKNGLGKTFYSGEPQSGEELVLDELANEEQVIFNFGASQNASLFIGGEEVEFPLDIIHQKISVTVAQ